MQNKRIYSNDLFDFSKKIMMHLNVPEKDAEVTSDNLVQSNLRGIDSHGVARLTRYVNGVKSGYIIPDAQPEIAKDSAVLANVDGHNGLGQVIGYFSMELAIKKASEYGFGMVTAFNSNHYGFAGYFALMALKKELIGVSMTNSAPLTVPTYGKNALIGTNPISVSAPAKKNRHWIMDFATSVVPRGKLEVYNRLGEKLPKGWATDENGTISDDPARVLNNLKNQYGGGILP
ncbi:MAG: Ldh family oxidoreductase, partial [Calditrichia bacterium]